MVKRFFSWITFFIFFSFSFFRVQAQDEKLEGYYKPHISHYVKIETSKGTFVIGLYDETPRHRDNFLELVRSKAYEGVLFHRTISQFMVQTGNLLTKGATAETNVSRDTIAERISAEILEGKLFHRRGSVAAARIGNEVNPLKESSKTQFYITTGTFFTDWDLNDYEATSDRKFTPYERKVYKTEGGVPSLDGEYTVFGEVVKGMDTIEKIENVKTDDNNRPKRDILIKRVTLIDKP